VYTVKGALPVEPGVTLGHEALGTVHAIGSGVEVFAVGQRVAVNAVTPLDAFGLGMADKSIHSGLCPGGNDRMQRIFALLQTGRFDPTLMTTHTFSFDEVERAFWIMANKEEGVIKPLITF